jgi:hypothetical protein
VRRIDGRDAADDPRREVVAGRIGKGAVLRGVEAPIAGQVRVRVERSGFAAGKEGDFLFAESAAEDLGAGDVADEAVLAAAVGADPQGQVVGRENGNLPAGPVDP